MMSLSERTQRRRRAEVREQMRHEDYDDECDCQTCSDAVQAILNNGQSKRQRDNSPEAGMDEAANDADPAPQDVVPQHEASFNVSEDELEVAEGMQSDAEDTESFLEEETSHDDSVQDDSEVEGNPVPDPEADPDPGPGSDPDDDQHSHSDSSSDSSDSDQEGAVRNNYNLSSIQLDVPLILEEGATCRDALALYISTAVRFNIPLKGLIHLLRGQNALLGYKALPDDKRKLFTAMDENCSGMKRHAYCAKCQSSFGILDDNSPDEFVCCNTTFSKKKVRYFITLSLKHQLKNFLSSPGVSEKLSYRERRTKVHANNLEDIMDGRRYRELQEPGGPLNSPHNFSYILNSDGFQVTESGHEEAWGLFVRLNEPHPTLRQKFVFLVALWMDEKKPNFDLFLDFFVDEANMLSTRGIRWTREGQEVVSLFIPTALVVDAKCRCVMLNMVDVTGHHGCTLCTHFGVSFGFGTGPVKFPTVPRAGQFHFDPPVLRTDEGMREAMEQAHHTRQRVEGHKGVTALMGLDHFDLARNQVTDDLHPWFEGAARTHLLIFLEKNRPCSISDQDIAILNRRMSLATTPTDLSRKPRDITKIGKWTGTELRNFLIHLGIPCLAGLVPRQYLDHWALLSNASYLLHKSSISGADLVQARQCIRRYKTQFEAFFGPQKMFFNIHMIEHSVKSCEDWGPQWAHSTMPFESWNFKLQKFYKSPTSPIKQMVRGYQLLSLANTFSLQEEISPLMREEIKAIMKKPLHKNVTSVGGAHFFGDSEMECPSAEELVLMERENVRCDRLQKFKRVLCNSIEFRCPLFNPSSRSNNTYLHAHDGKFYRTQKIVIVHDGDLKHCGLFATQMQVIRRPTNAPYMAYCTESNVSAYLNLNSVHALCVAVKVGRELCVAPIPNHFEID